MDPWTLLALFLVVGTVTAVAAPQLSKRAGTAMLRHGGRGVRAGAKHGGRGVGSAVKAAARWSKPRLTGALGRAWGGARKALGRLVQRVADTGRTTGNPAKPKPETTRLDRLAGWLRGPAPEQPAPPVPTAPPASKPSLVKSRPSKPAVPANPATAEPKGTHVMSDVTRGIVAAFDHLGDLEVDSVAELEELTGDLSIMWAKIGIAYEQFLNNQEAIGIAAKPLRQAYNSLDGLDDLSTGARDARTDLRDFYEAYFEQAESGKTPKIGLLDPAKADAA